MVENVRGPTAHRSDQKNFSRINTYQIVKEASAVEVRSGTRSLVGFLTR